MGLSPLLPAHLSWKSVLNRERTKTHALLPSLFLPYVPPHTSKEREYYGTELKEEFPKTEAILHVMDLGFPISRAVRNEIYFVYNPDTKSVYLLCLLGRLKGYSLSTLLHNRDTD